ncbi:hypothetical protein [Clostridium mediterraneense]|uniref:hypothetical protein n=1 Tax=Clostridium mediterraneense TaxID=1805472 RepID=UPI00082F1496|nr:hypothetical protein [Clostridium mediterraneense]
MKKLIIAAIVALLILIGFTAYIYNKAHSAPKVTFINNEQQQPSQKYIPRIPTPAYFPEQPASPVPAAVEPYLGTWVVKSITGIGYYPATNATTYGVGKTITIEPDYFNNDCEMYPEAMKNPQYSVIYPSAEDLINSYHLGSAAQVGLYGGVPTLVVNRHGSPPNQDPKFNFGDVYLMGSYIIVNSNGVFFRCVRK